MTTIVQTGTAVGYFRVSSPGQAGERHVSLAFCSTVMFSGAKLRVNFDAFSKANLIREISLGS